jgi:hypothetical protein
MSKRKAASSWEAQCRAEIDGGDADAVRTIAKTLEKLQRAVQERLIKQQQVTGCGVCLIKSNQSQDQDVGCNMCSRSVDASFTAGPKAAAFTISFSCEDMEGDETIVVESELFHYEEGDCSDVSDDEIAEFLQKAGLFDARSKHAEDDESDAQRRRWVYGEVICDAVELVVDKHGHQDNCGVGLGMGSEDIYGWLGMEY